jgi:hypothetical protein
MLSIEFSFEDPINWLNKFLRIKYSSVKIAFVHQTQRHSRTTSLSISLAHHKGSGGVEQKQNNRNVRLLRRFSSSPSAELVDIYQTQHPLQRRKSTNYASRSR